MWGKKGHTLREERGKQGWRSGSKIGKRKLISFGKGWGSGKHPKEKIKGKDKRERREAPGVLVKGATTRKTEHCAAKKKDMPSVNWERVGLRGCLKIRQTSSPGYLGLKKICYTRAGNGCCLGGFCLKSTVCLNRGKNWEVSSMGKEKVAVSAERKS